jgi:uncharacterized delta-60 repeat protein
MEIRRRNTVHIAIAVAALLAFGAFGSPAALAAGGDLDPGFGSGGKVATTFPGGALGAAVAVDPDRRIVVAGAAAGSSGTGEFALARYDAAGDLDPTFGSGGRVTTPIAGGNGDEARAVAIQANGRIVVAGTDSMRRFAVVRYRSDGSLDTTFGGDGKVTTDFAPGDDIAWDVAIQTDGRIVAVGGAGFGQEGFRLARYRRDGTLDPTFGDDGRVVTRYRGANARAVALQRNGRIVVTGYNTRGLALARYRPNGRLDRSFSGDGTVGAVASQILALAVAVQPDGRIVVTGDHDIFRVGLARFRRDGRLDRSFGGNGLVRTRLGPGEQALNGVVVRASGAIVAAGYTGPHEFGDPTAPRFVAARYEPDGSLDDAFGGDGKVATFFEGGARASGIAVHGGGIVVAGSAVGGAGTFALVRYLS